MSKININKYISDCKQLQPQSQVDIRRFFEGVVGFAYDRELLLQAYLFLNIKSLFPLCTELLLFEQALVKNNTNLGKCDFIYLTDQNNLFLIETKFIDTEETGKTAITRRTQHRKKVFEQVFSWQSKLTEHCNIPTQQIECAIFTTDSTLSKRAETLNVLTKSIRICELEQWQKEYNRRA